MRLLMEVGNERVGAAAAGSITRDAHQKKVLDRLLRDLRVEKG